MENFKFEEWLMNLDKFYNEALKESKNIDGKGAADIWKYNFLNKGFIAGTLENMNSIPEEFRKDVGIKANDYKRKLLSVNLDINNTISQAQLEQSIKNEKLDVTLPGSRPTTGRLHPLTQTLRKIIRIFAEMGFQVFRSRDVETDEFNFELLNMPAFHPARDMWDTFHTTLPNVVLRTHTSPGQIHVMRKYCPEPIRVILPGMCYRYEQMDARHESQIMQVEVLAVGRHITMADLKGTLIEFARGMYGQNVRSRFRPSYFPFTEPSGDLEIECFICHGKGCKACRGSGWLEIMGCGMIHPIVLRNGGYDPEKFSGFAAGMGVERVAMLLNSVEEIRYFYGNDIRFLEQFS
jgi:phenylalanyl-tRNA synthetase alpha chain